MTISVTLDADGMFAVRTPKNRMFVDALKASIPAQDRAWVPSRVLWLVTPRHGPRVQELIKMYYGHDVTLPPVTNRTAIGTIEETLRVEYIGAAKERAGLSERTAYGFSEGEWSVIFPEAVLRKWFSDESSSIENATLYQVLGVNSAATADEIKSGYRRMARQWHPDVCKEPNASERFRRITQAYEMLNEPNKRARYDAGLLLESKTYNASTGRRGTANGMYFPPLRCGMITASGTYKVNRFVVDEIERWDDILDEKGRILVTSWPRGANSFTKEWVSNE